MNTPSFETPPLNPPPLNTPPGAPPPRRPAASLAATALGGALIMLLGLAWLSNNLGFFNTWSTRAVGAWPLIFILFGLGNVLGLRQHRSVVGPLLVAAGAWEFAIEQGWLEAPFWAVFAPTAVVIFGAAIVWRSQRPGPPPMTRAPGAPVVPAQGYINVFSMFSGNELRPSMPFEGANVTAVMGGAKLDLSHTPMEQAQASIDVFLLMGGAEIIVPPDWEVTASPLVFMGGVADKRRSVAPRSKRLFINGGVFLGGVEIKD